MSQNSKIAGTLEVAKDASALAVRTAEIRIIAVADGARAGDVITDLAGDTPGRRLVVSDRLPEAGHAFAGDALSPPAGAHRTVVPRNHHRAEAPGHEH